MTTKFAGIQTSFSVKTTGGLPTLSLLLCRMPEELRVQANRWYVYVAAHSLGYRRIVGLNNSNPFAQHELIDPEAPHHQWNGYRPGGLTDVAWGSTMRTDGISATGIGEIWHLAFSTTQPGFTEYMGFVLRVMDPDSISDLVVRNKCLLLSRLQIAQSVSTNPDDQHAIEALMVVVRTQEASPRGTLLARG